MEDDLSDLGMGAFTLQQEEQLSFSKGGEAEACSRSSENVLNCSVSK